MRVIVSLTAIAIDHVRSLRFRIPAQNISRKYASHRIFHEQDTGSLAGVLRNGASVEQEGRFRRVSPRRERLQGRIKNAGKLDSVQDLHTVSPRHRNRPFSSSVVADALLENPVGIDSGGLHQMFQRAHTGHVGEYRRNVVEMVEGNQRRDRVSREKPE